ncbi:hypothetical protein LAV84_28770 [Rhizobium sp. VS19-DR104.2]|uniref:hypothetical protein n=1 Tax=unclassified Rhizobium TaxID=2613769 RepID=UPI001CC5948D|nr:MULTISPECIES: hypothetical protein [unclassified Rhizobium]MBZ5763056.1 hypothetical protein [Rhizobium sp. VS19-DR96]MBZ5769606.1 hypothetical protein [Rhizobium sp. VS19-DR129.2]MBZ5776364.1 hypothetical protein [Rhizobium sp. VS19-DRK62.2]MBZ5787571.1 hypothetical protein [Rhizobium sp. VS19-DR121]MBZ5804926.1 hypothetical protein [Rhizobium sp. VS19-DR181]
MQDGIIAPGIRRTKRITTKRADKAAEKASSGTSSTRLAKFGEKLQLFPQPVNALDCVEKIPNLQRRETETLIAIKAI